MRLQTVQFRFPRDSFDVLGILWTYIFDEIRNKSGWFCWNNNFTVTKIHCDFNRVIFINLGLSFKWSTARKWTNSTIIVDGIFDFSAVHFHKLSSSIIFDWLFTYKLSMTAHFESNRNL